jgi:hypothetical protein
VASSFRDLATSVSVNNELEVTDGNGQRVRGRLVELNDAALILSISAGDRGIRHETFSELDVQRVVLTDSVVDGAIIGAAIGVVPGAVLGLAAVAANEDASPRSKQWIVAPVVGAAVSAGLFALLGIHLDRGLDPIVYESPQRRTSINVAPLLGVGRNGVLVSLQF